MAGKIQIRIELMGRTLHSISESEITEGGSVIGRAKSCDHRLPSEESSVSSKHAKIFRRGRDLFIEDLASTNGLVLKGKRVEKSRLKEGQSYSLGACTLTVEEGTPGIHEREPSYLIPQTGPLKQNRILLDQDVTLIGARGDADVRLLHELVSQKHAEIRVQDDGVWIVDLGSRNGTYINQVPLVKDKERLLRDGDRIGIAHFELAFFDGAIFRPPSRVKLKLAVAFSVALLGWLLYAGYQNVAPSAGDLLAEARSESREMRFEKSLELLESAEQAKGFSEQELNIRTLRRRIGTWNSAYAGWIRFRESLDNKDWIAVSRILSELSSLDRDAWTWNDESLTFGNRVAVSKKAMDAFLEGRSTSAQAAMNVDLMTETVTTLETVLAQIQEDADPVVGVLAEPLEKVLGDLNLVIAQITVLEGALNRLQSANPPFDEILEQLEAVRRSDVERVRRQADRVFDPLKGLATANGEFYKSLAAAVDMRFSECLANSLKLPSVDDCAVDRRLSSFRERLSNQNENLMRAVVVLDSMVQRLNGEVEPGGKMPGSLRFFENGAVVSDVLTCDVLDGRLPDRLREEPTSTYDRALGVEEFYQRLNLLPEPFDPQMVGGSVGFRPEIRRLQEVCKDAADLLAFMGQPNDPKKGWMHQRRLGEFHEQLQDLLERRKKIVRGFVRRLAESRTTTRQRVILGGMICALAESPWEIKMNDVACPEWTKAKFDELSKEVRKIWEEYFDASPIQQVSIREKILGTGVPGDGILRSMWASRDAARNMAR